jgi:Domain of unknown function (DUF1841)
LPQSGEESAWLNDDTTDCWFDEPQRDVRRSWAVPAAHGTYHGIDLEPLDPADEDDLGLLIEALHSELQEALRSNEEVLADDEPFSPRLHIAMHQVVANQLLADDPPEVWRTVQRLADLGYDWHNVMHMIAALVTEDVYGAISGGRKFDRGDYAIRLRNLPGDWPPPQTPGTR